MRITRFISAIIISTTIMPFVTVAQDRANEQFLRDDYVIGGLDGRLVDKGNGKWFFEFETDVSDGKATLKAGETLEILKSSTVEKMIEDAKTRNDARYRLWGKITKFGEKNYIFASYFLAMRKMEDRRQKTENKKQNSPSTARPGTPQAVNDPNDIVKIPEEIVAKLKTSEVLPESETPQTPLELKQDSIFANRVGFVIEKNGSYIFQPDGLGRGVEKYSIELLPCQPLEEAIAQTHGEPNPVRFSVAGILTRYKDRQLLLMQKATRIYSYGNFGR